MSSSSRYEREPHSAPGDFYAVKGECMSCGVPHVVAPDLIGWVSGDGRHCYWKKQPETEVELNQAFAIFDGQELGCHRYAGHDPEIQSRIDYFSCDYAPPHTGPSPFSPNYPPPRELSLLPFETPGLLRRLWNKLRRN